MVEDDRGEKKYREHEQHDSLLAVGVSIKQTISDSPSGQVLTMDTKACWVLQKKDGIECSLALNHPVGTRGGRLRANNIAVQGLVGRERRGAMVEVNFMPDVETI